MSVTDEQPVWHEDIKPEPDTKLEQLSALFDEAMSAYNAAKERLDEIKGALKDEMVAAAPNKTSIRLTSPYLRLPLQLTAKRGARRIDARRLEAEQPDIYDQYARLGNPSWDLRAVKS